MLKSLYPDVDWEKISIVGFDMDGTLYDEMDFIVQVYKPISELLARYCHVNAQDIYNWMVTRWLEKGSSYNYIFDEVLSKSGVTKNRENIIHKCILIYRSFEPEIVLSSRVRYLLDYFKKNYEMFLISDGNAVLQKAKFNSLKLDTWFTSDNVFFTGSFGNAYYKPSILLLEKFGFLKGLRSEKIVFFGDRELDERFATKAGFQFVYVRCLS